MKPEIAFDRKQLIFLLSVVVVAIVVGVLLVIYGPVLSVRPFNSTIVTRAVGVLGLIGGVHESFYLWPLISRWNQTPIDVDSSGMTLLAVRRPPVRIEWQDIKTIDATKKDVAITLAEGAAVTLWLDVIRIDGRRPWPGQLADHLTRLHEARLSG
ncbi:MAG: hypothetical protein GY720_18790 [bacterium]|nr:hypothetical protein [bacterium]